MNDSATSTIATVPMAKASGAAAPAACTTKVILKAAVTVGQMTETDKPTASGRLKRLTNFPIPILSSLFPCQASNFLQLPLAADLPALTPVLAQGPIIPLPRHSPA